MATEPDTAIPAPQKWVVGTDGSDHADHALAWAALHARARGAEIELVSAWSYPIGIFAIEGGPTTAVDASMREIVEDSLAERAARTRADHGVTVVTGNAVGPASHVLLDASRGADLLIVGRRGRGGFARLLLGSVSHQVACHAPCPTVIVSDEPHREAERIVVGVDGSANSIAALRWAHGFMSPGGALVAVSTWEPPHYSEAGLEEAVLSTLPAAEKQRVDAEITAFEDGIAAPGLVTRVFETGHAGEQLVKHGSTADLLVVGARGRSGIAAALLGSTTTWVAHHPPCPTVVVPADPPEIRNP